MVDTLQPTASQKGLELSTHVDEMYVQADPKLLKRVLTNLISNAIKFTEQGFVKIMANQDEKFYTISVQDSGIGLSEQQIKGLFQKYHQVDSAKPGFGLGLFISRQFVQAHGGTLEVSSTPGQGSTFKIALPKEHI